MVRQTGPDPHHDPNAGRRRRRPTKRARARDPKGFAAPEANTVSPNLAAPHPKSPNRSGSELGSTNPPDRNGPDETYRTTRPGRRPKATIAAWIAVAIAIAEVVLRILER